MDKVKKKGTKRVFVFGSNLKGDHCGGSALEALKNHGAVKGQGVGRQGDSYAIPTLHTPGGRKLSLKLIAGHVAGFLAHATEDPGTTFDVVKVGCGIAGFTEDQIRPMFAGAPPNVNLPEGWDSRLVYVLRTCDKDMGAYGGFKWPKKGRVECPDWKPEPACGNGLHGLLWGAGDHGLLSWDATAKWMVVAVPASGVVAIDGGQKVKFTKGEVVFCGKRDKALQFLVGHGADPSKMCCRSVSASGYGGQATASGYGGQATASGYRGQATASGDGGQATASGYRGQATASGVRGQATASGYGGQATAGSLGIVVLRWWDRTADRYRLTVGYPGEDGVREGYWYRADAEGKLVEVGPVKKAKE